MGIRFRCHHCEHELNLKEFQAGRRARCPACSGRFRVPTSSAEVSLPLDEQEAQLASAATATAQQGSGGTFNLRPSSADPDLIAGRTGVAERTIGDGGSILPKAIQEAPQAVWYVRPPSGGQYGPAEAHHFLNWLQDNRISPDSLVWRDGWPQWQLAGDVFVEFFGDGWRLAHSAGGTVAESVGEVFGSSETHASPEEPAVSSVALNRKKKKQATYGILIGIMALVAIILVGVLISVVL